MRGAFFLAWLVSVLPLAAWSETTAEQRAKINQAALAVYRMHATYDESRGATGSAIHLGGGRFATSCHLTRDAKGVQISRGPKRWHAYYQHKNVERDLCIILTHEVPEHAAQLGDASKMRVGQRVYSVGYPAALTGLNIQFGTIRALYDFDGGKIIRTTAFFARGESGGALFDDTGKVVGVLTFKSRTGPGHNFAVPVNWVDEVEMRAQGKPSAPDAATFWEPSFATPPAFLAAAALEADERWGELAEFSRDWLRSATHDPESLLALSKALYHTEHARAALEPVRKALALDPEHAEVWFQLALIYAKLNDAEERDKAYARVAQLSPDRALDLADVVPGRRTGCGPQESANQAAC